MTAIVPFRLSGVGDISFEGSEADAPSIECFENVVPDFRQADLVVGNLECVLTGTGTEGTPGKCMLRGAPEWAYVLKEAGIGLVTLANNHSMDYGVDGLVDTMNALAEANVNFVGAGHDINEACKPLFLDIAQRRVAFLARTAVVVSEPAYATTTEPGVALLDADQTVEAIGLCRAQADLVVVMVHWGIEEYCYPSPAQRLLAKRFTDAGADLVLGHHPHVLQGTECIGAGMVAYSLGNFVFNEFGWSYPLPDGTIVPQFSPLTRENRDGIIATFEWQEAGTPVITTRFTRIRGRGQVAVDDNPVRQAQWKDLCASLERCCYGAWWRWYAMHVEWALRFGHRVSLRKILTNLHRVRFRHLLKALGMVRRSLRIVSEKSTNPYE